jgi:hypothetical protein
MFQSHMLGVLEKEDEFRDLLEDTEILIELPRNNYGMFFQFHEISLISHYSMSSHPFHISCDLGEYTPAENLVRKRRCKSSTPNRLLLVLMLMWLTNYSIYPFLSFVFGIDQRVITQVCLMRSHFTLTRRSTTSCGSSWRHMRGRFSGRMSSNAITSKEPSPNYHMAIGHIDGVVSRRNRPGHRQSAYYRGDKRYHFMSSQMVVDHSGMFHLYRMSKLIH